MKTLILLAALAAFPLALTAQTRQPAFAALDMNGNRVDTAAMRGKIVVINLWFINCPNCVEEIKSLNEIVEAYRDNKDVVFLGLAASPKPQLEKFLVKNPFKYTVLPNAQMIILGKFGTPDKKGEINLPFPMHYVLDRQGNIVTKTQGTKGVETVKNELKRQFPSK
jgi:peroxiredoxin